MAGSFLLMILAHVAFLSPCSGENVTANATLVHDPLSFKVVSESVQVQRNVETSSKTSNGWGDSLAKVSTGSTKEAAKWQEASTKVFLQKRTNETNPSATPAGVEGASLVSLPESEDLSNMSPSLTRSSVDPDTVGAAIEGLSLILDAVGFGVSQAGGGRNTRLNLFPSSQNRFKMNSFTEVGGGSENLQNGVVLRAAGSSKAIVRVDVLADSMNIVVAARQPLGTSQLARDFIATVGTNRIKDLRGGGDQFKEPVTGQVIAELLVRVNNRIFQLTVLHARERQRNTWYIGSRYGRKNSNSIFAYAIQPSNGKVQQNTRERLVISQTERAGGRGFQVSLQGF